MIFCTALFRKADFDSIGGYAIEFNNGLEDWDFWIRILKNDGEVYQIPEKLFYYRIHSSSRNSKLVNNNNLQKAAILYYFKLLKAICIYFINAFILFNLIEIVIYLCYIIFAIVYVFFLYI